MTRKMLAFLSILLLVACSTPEEQVTSSPTFLPAVPSPTPTSQVSLPPSAVELPIMSLRRAGDENDLRKGHFPDIWTGIDRTLITFYPHNRLNDYVYAPNGDLWLAGGFGVIRQRPDGKQTWYSVQNGLPVNYFQTIAIAPNGEVWVGGAKNALFRFDGQEWHDEGQYLPAPLDGRDDWLCYSQNIFGIDFDKNGQIWVANAGLELYTRQDGHWFDFGFPKDILPQGGGGGCPYALHVASPKDIAIARYGCCSMPDVVYHFDGQTWTADEDLSAIQEHLASHHGEGRLPQYGIGALNPSKFSFPFSEERILPFTLYPGSSAVSITFDEQGTLWATDHDSLFRKYPDNPMKDLAIMLKGPLLETDFSEGTWLNFLGDPIFFDVPPRYQEFSRWVWGVSELGIRLVEESYASELEAEGRGIRFLSYSLDSQNRVWFYLPGRGLVVAEKGKLTVYNGVPDLTAANLGGLQALPDGRVLVGSTGAIWVFEQGYWQKWVLPNTVETFRLFAIDPEGILYAATDTAVYRIQYQEFRVTRFAKQDAQPVVAGHGDSAIVYHKRYSEFGYFYERNIYPEFPLHYRALLLKVLPDGTVLFVNSHILAQFDGKTWRSFLFEQMNFDSAAVDPDGNLWVYAGYHGLLKFDPNIFQSYRGLVVGP